MRETGFSGEGVAKGSGQQTRAARNSRESGQGMKSERGKTERKTRALFITAVARSLAGWLLYYYRLHNTTLSRSLAQMMEQVKTSKTRVNRRQIVACEHSPF